MILKTDFEMLIWVSTELFINLELLMLINITSARHFHFLVLADFLDYRHPSTPRSHEARLVYTTHYWFEFDCIIVYKFISLVP